MITSRMRNWRIAAERDEAWRVMDAKNNAALAWAVGTAALVVVIAMVAQ